MLVLLLGDLHLPLRAASLPLKFRKLLVPGKIQQIICTGNVCDRETWDYLRTVAPDVRGVRGDFDESPHLPPTLTITHGSFRLGIIHGHQILPLGDPDLLGSLAVTMDVDVLVSGATHRFEAYEANGRFFVNPGSATGAWSSVWPLVVTPIVAKEEETDEEGKGAAGANKDSQPASTEKKEEAAADTQAPASKDDSPASAAPAPAATPASPTKTSAVPAAAPPTPHPDPTPSFVLLDIQGSALTSYVYQLISNEVKVDKIEFKKSTEGNDDDGSTTAAAARSSGAGAGRMVHTDAAAEARGSVVRAVEAAGAGGGVW